MSLKLIWIGARGVWQPWAENQDQSKGNPFN